MLKKYKIGFDVWALWIFAVIMLPNIVWLIYSGPDDLFYKETVTPKVDLMANIFRCLMLVSLCFIRNKTANRSIKSSLPAISGACCMFYYSAWIFYFCGEASNLIIISLCIFPCLAFLIFTVFRKNPLAFIFAAIFTVLHIISTTVNYIM